MQLAELADKLKADLLGAGTIEVKGIATLTEATPEEVSFVSGTRYAEAAAASRAGALIVPDNFQGKVPAALLRVADVEAAVEEALLLFAPAKETPVPGVHPAACVAASARLGADVTVGPGAVIGEDVCIGAGTVVGPGCILERQVQIGAGCRLGANVVVAARCVLGNRVIVYPNSTIGADGFGYRLVAGRHRKIPHIGTVVIEDDVEIGANCCIDRAKLGRTVIGTGSKIDNLVQIAHNVQIGAHCIIAAQTGIAGSARLGRYVVLGGQVGVRDHVGIGEGAQIAATAAVERNIEAGVRMVGAPARPAREFFRRLALWERLPELARELKRLKQRVERIDGTTNHIASPHD